MNIIASIHSLAANAAAELAVLPVDAQATFLIPSIFAWVNAVDIPLSLKEPVGLFPSNCNQKLSDSKPTNSATLVKWKGLVFPSSPSKETRILLYSS